MVSGTGFMSHVWDFMLRCYLLWWCSFQLDQLISSAQEWFFEEDKNVGTRQVVPNCLMTTNPKIDFGMLLILFGAGPHKPLTVTLNGQFFKLF